MRMMLPTDKSLLAECKRGIQAVVPNAEVVLFGSRARSDAQPDSDYDLLILVDQEPTIKLEKEILDYIYPIELKHDAMVSFVIHSKRNWKSPSYRAMPFHQNVEREGVRL